MNGDTRTRFAPSPTGMMHVGNLRTALYEFLIAKSQGGKFILRIEDTDQERQQENAVDVIYRTLEIAKLKHDEGPDIGGEYGPYIQSERLNLYKKFAEELVVKDKAYYCFCSKERLENIKKESDSNFTGYDRHCRDLSKDEIEKLLKQNTPYVIRQKMPLTGSTTFKDLVYGEVTTPNEELDDQILIKSDGFPTYNFANVIDDHLMGITHVVRGSEYLSSTPKYNLLYDAFSWNVPAYIHLPLIMGKNEDGSVSKLSKRHGSTGFFELIEEGYIPEAIINYIALLGWSPRDNTEIFSLDDLIKEFSIDRINKSSAIFDYAKLQYINGEHLKRKTLSEFERLADRYIQDIKYDKKKICDLLKNRVTKLTEIPEMVGFFEELSDYDIDYFVNKRNKTDFKISQLVLEKVSDVIESIKTWEYNEIHDKLMELCKDLGLKIGSVMWPIRIALSGRTVTAGGAIEILDILGKDESLRRIKFGIKKLKDQGIE